MVREILVERKFCLGNKISKCHAFYPHAGILKPFSNHGSLVPNIVVHKEISLMKVIDLNYNKGRLLIFYCNFSNTCCTNGLEDLAVILHLLHGTPANF